jgi:hypothetical protein
MIPGDDPAPLTVDEFVGVTVQVHVEDLASFYKAVGEWWDSVKNEGSKGRARVG